MPELLLTLKPYSVYLLLDPCLSVNCELETKPLLCSASWKLLQFIAEKEPGVFQTPRWESGSLAVGQKGWILRVTNNLRSNPESVMDEGSAHSLYLRQYVFLYG